MAMVWAALLMYGIVCTNSQYIYPKENNRCAGNGETMVRIRDLLIKQGRIQEFVETLRQMVKRLEEDVTKTYEDVQIVKREKIYKDCSEILKRDPSKRGQDGVYVIYPGILLEVFCDMTTDGGGWTTIQKRQDGDVDFNRTWNEYKVGFGNASKNYWLGNEGIHTLTKDKNQELRVDLQRHNGEQAYAVYSTFYIGDEYSKYTLTVSGYNGNASDSMTYHNGMKFTTKDQDNDMRSSNCAIDYMGAWWYRKCYASNLNGEYAQSAVYGKQYVVWYYWKNTFEALKKTVMMIRPKN